MRKISVWGWALVMIVCTIALSLPLSRALRAADEDEYDPVRRSFVNDSFRVRVLGSVDMTHDDAVYDVIYTRDGKRIISTGGDGAVRVWNAATGVETLSFQAHSSWGMKLAATSDGKQLLSAGYNAEVFLWSLETGRQLAALSQYAEDGSDVKDAATRDDLHLGWLTGAAIAGDDKTAVTLCSGGKLIVWDLETKKAIRSFKVAQGNTSLALTRDGKTLAVGGNDKLITLYSIDGDTVATLKGHTDQIVDLAFCGDDTQLLSASWDLTLKLWDIEQREEIRTLAGHKQKPYAIAANGGATLGLSATLGGGVRLWNLENGEKERDVLTRQGWIYGAAFSPDGKRFATGGKDNTVRVYDVATGGQVLPVDRHREFINSGAITPDAKRVMIQRLDHTYSIIDIDNNIEAALGTHRGWGTCVAVDNQCERAVTCVGKMYQIIDLKTSETIATVNGDSPMKGPSPAHMLPGGKQLLVGSASGELRLHNLADGKLVREFKGHNNVTLCLAVSPDGALAFSASYDGIRLWDLETGEEKLAVKEQLIFTAAVFSPDSSLVYAYAPGQVLHSWNLETAELSQLFETNRSHTAVMCLPGDDSKLLMAGDRAFHFVDADSGETLSTVNNRASDIVSNLGARYLNITIAPGGGSFIVANANGTLSVYTKKQ